MVRFHLIHGLRSELEPVLQVGEPGDVAVTRLLGVRDGLAQPLGFVVRRASGRAELAELLGQRRHRSVGLMQPGERDLDGGTGLTMLLVQLALSEAQPLACVTGLGQSPLGVVDCRLHLDQCWVRGRSASGKMSTENVSRRG